MVTLKFLGGTKEVGRSALAISTKKSCVLVDYGVLIEREPGFPMHIPPKQVDAIIISHAHLDHSGGAPIFYITGKKPLYATPVTIELTELLVKDFIHLSGYYLPYEYVDLRTMVESSIPVGYGKWVRVGDISFKLLNAGHIPGSSQVLIEAGGKRILYTSDFNTIPTRLLRPAKYFEEELDAIVIESTYANQDHPNREALEKEFIEEVTEVVERGGTVLIPAFSVGRAQEVLCIFEHYQFEYPVTVDGMAREANEILLRHPKYLRDPKLLSSAISQCIEVGSWRDRRIAVKKPGVIVSPAGMLRGGPASFYLQKIAEKPYNAIFLVSYQLPNTPGRILLEKKIALIKGRQKKVSADVKHFDFSSHCGSTELKKALESVEGSPKVFVVHGAEGNCEILAEYASQELGLEVYVPKAGDTFRI